MVEKCCGSIVRTPHCPFCGRKFTDADPLAALLDYCDTNLKRARMKLKESERDFERVKAMRNDTRTPVEEWDSVIRATEKTLSHRQRSARRWELWRNALAKVVETEREDSNGST